MDRSIPLIFTSIFILVSTTSLATPSTDADATIYAQTERWRLLDEPEMTETSGSMGPIALGFWAIGLGGGVGGTTAASVQYEATGSVTLGTVVAGTLAGATAATVSTLAAASGSPLVLVGAAVVDTLLTLGVDSNIPAPAPVGPPTPKVDLSKLNIPPSVPPAVLYGASVHIVPAAALASAPSPDFGRGGGAGEEHYLYF